MTRVHIITEGTTEKNFVDDILKPYLASKGVFVDAHSVTTRRDRRKNKVFRGGLDSVDHLLKDLKIWLNESASDPNCWVTTMVDLYAFPYEQKTAWINGLREQPDGQSKALFLESKIKEELNSFSRFIPYIQIHEYEALLLVNTNAIHYAFSEIYPESNLILLNKDIGNVNPEEVNDGRHTAPSKRIIKYYPQYEDNKPIWGSLIAGEIGINNIRDRCPHFNQWVTSLEALATNNQ